MTVEAQPAEAAAAAGFVTPSRLVMAIFFLHAVGLANWFPRIPDLQAKLGIGPGELAVALLGMPLATVIAAPFAGTLIARHGPRRVLCLSLPLVTLGVALPAWAQDVATLFGALFLIGLAYPVVDIAMNVEANRIERAGGRRIMSTCHGCWSVGSVAGGLMATGFAAGHIRPEWHLLIVAVVMSIPAVLIPRALPEVRGGDESQRVTFTLPSRGILLLCGFVFGTLMMEATARNWSAVYVRDVVKASDVYAGLTYSAFAFFMALGRFAGDRLIDRFGPVPVARVCCGIAFLGILLVVLASSPVEVVIGFGAAGFGAALGFPLTVTAAASRGDRPPAVNVAAMQLIGVGAFLSNPPLIGVVAEFTNLRVGLAVMLPMILASALLAGELERKAGPG